MNNLQKLKLYELKVLKEIDRICKKYNIKYYLAFGSALGAIRHKGFIPWDDDIDLHMTYSDLIKFKMVCKTELSKEFYFQGKLTDKYYYNYWGKVGLENTTWMPKNRIVDCKYGICVDIFPMMEISDNYFSKLRYKLLLKIILVTSSKYYVLNNKSGSLLGRLFHMVVPLGINNIMYKFCYYLMAKSKGRDLVGIYCIEKDIIYYFKYDDIIGNKELSFEGDMYLVPNNIDNYLTTFYGDYMKPPAKDKRYGHDRGNDIIYDFDKSYLDYMEVSDD